jgi:hypothetical protein
MENDRVVGFYSLQLRDGLCELDNFWIRPDAIGNGYGRQLLEHAKAVAKNLGVRELMIDSDPNARSFTCAAALFSSGEFVRRFRDTLTDAVLSSEYELNRNRLDDKRPFPDNHRLWSVSIRPDMIRTSCRYGVNCHEPAHFAATEHRPFL